MNRRDFCHRHFAGRKNTYMVKSEIRLLDGETCLSKIIICDICWRKINSKLFFAKAIVFLDCFSTRSLV